MKHIPKKRLTAKALFLCRVALAVSLLLHLSGCFSTGNTSPQKAKETNPYQPFTLLFSNNGAGEYQPCG